MVDTTRNFVVHLLTLFIMKQQPNSIRFPHPFSCGIHLYVLLTVLLFARLSMHGQSTELAGCTTGEYPFSGEKAPTLCEKYSGITCDWEIGAGTLYPKASDIGTVITGNVCIIGDFEIEVSGFILFALLFINLC